MLVAGLGSGPFGFLLLSEVRGASLQMVAPIWTFGGQNSMNKKSVLFSRVQSPQKRSEIGTAI